MTDILGGIIDPFNITGLRKTDSDNAQDEYNKSLDEYKKAYEDASKLGIPLDLLGFEKPTPSVKIAGGKGLPSLKPIGGPDLPPPLVPRGVETNPRSLTNRVRAATSRLRVVIDNVRSSRSQPPFVPSPVHEFKLIDEEEEEQLERTRREIGGGMTAAEAKRSREEKRAEEQGIPLSVFLGERKEGRRGFGGQLPVTRQTRAGKKKTANNVYIQPVTTLLMSLIRQGSGGLRIDTSGFNDKDKDHPFRRLWLNNYSLQNRIIGILNDFGIDLSKLDNNAKKSTIQPIIDMIMNDTSSLPVELNNAINDELREEARTRGLNDIIDRFEILPFTATERPPTPTRGENLPIREIPDLRENLVNAFTELGMNQTVTERYIDGLITFLEEETSRRSVVRGGMDSAREEIQFTLQLYANEAYNIAREQRNSPRLNLHNLGKLTLQVIQDLKEAFQTVGNMSSADKLDVFKKFAEQMKLNNREPPLPDWEKLTEKGTSAQDQMLQQTIRESMPTSEVKSSPLGSSGSQGLEEILGLPQLRPLPPAQGMPPVKPPPSESTPLMGSTAGGRAPVRPPTRGAEGNITLIGAQGRAALIRMFNYGRSNDLFSWRNLRIRSDPPGPDDPPGHSGWISIRTPRGWVSIERRNFILALVILGVTEESIRKIINQIDNAKDTVFHVGDKTKGGETKILTPSDANYPIELSDDYQNMTRSERTMELIKRMNAPGVSDKRKKDYKDIIDNMASEARKGDTRPPAVVEREREAFTVPFPDEGEKIELTQQLIDAGLRADVNRYNQLVDTIQNAKETGGDAERIAALNRKLDGIYGDINAQAQRPPKIELPTEKESEKRVEYDNTILEKAQVDYLRAVDHLKNAEANGVDPATLNDLRIGISERLALLKRREAEKRDADRQLALSTPTSYLTDREKEVFPSTREGRKKFARVQQLEQSVRSFKDPNAQDWYNSQMNPDTTAKNQRSSFATEEEYYDNRIALLEDIHNKFKQAVPAPPAIEGLSTSETAEDPDTLVSLDYDQTKEQGEGLARADMIDPAEAELFLSTKKEADAEQRRWEEYSIVQPGFGLGGPMVNGLQRHNLRQERKRFTNNFKTPKPYYVPSIKTIEERADPRDQPIFTPIYQNAFGAEKFDDSFKNTYQKGDRILFTNPYLTSNNQREWENPSSIYHPEYSLYYYNSKPTLIGETSKPAEYRFTNERKNYNNGTHPQTANDVYGFPTGVSDTMRNDRIFCNEPNPYLPTYSSLPKPENNDHRYHSSRSYNAATSNGSTRF